MWTMSELRNRNGFAMVFVVLIVIAMLIPAIILAASAISRRKITSGESVSERVLTIADASVDNVLSEINKFPEMVENDPAIQSGIDNINTYYKNNPPDPPNKMQEAAEKYIIAYLLSKLNGGTVYQPQPDQDPYPYFSGDDYADASFSEGDGSIWDIEDNIATYLYNISEDQYYVVWDSTNNCVAAVNKVGIDGDILSKPIAKVSGIASGEIIGSTKDGLAQWDPKFDTDNNWVEIDLNVQYVDDGQNKPHSARFKIRTTSYLLSKSDVSHIQRSILAEASLDALQVNMSSESGSGSSSNNNSDFPAAFKHAVWSGGNTIINGLARFEAANINTDGSYDVLNKGGDLYGQGNIMLNGNIRINGYLITAKKESEKPITMNGLVKVKEGVVYNKQETLPNFAEGAEDKVKSNAMSNGTVHQGDYTVNDTNYDIVVNGVSAPYYIGGNASINGRGSIHFYPTSDEPHTALYVGGNLELNGNQKLIFNSPGIIWVHGNVVINGNIKIIGSGTIVSDGQIILNGMANVTYSSDKDMVAFVSEGKANQGGIIVNGFNRYDSIFYAPHSDIVINGASTIYGTVVAGGWDLGNGLWHQGVIINGNSKMIFDTRLAGYTPPDGSTPPPPLPNNNSANEVKGAQFSLETIYRLSWREIISDPVTNKNIRNLNPVFKFSE